MAVDTLEYCPAQSFSEILRSIVIKLINAADDPLEREDRIQIALDEGAIDYPTAYGLRCGDL